MILRLSMLLLVATSCAAPAPERRAIPSSFIATSLNSSLYAVCTPSQCIQGTNSLAAGTTIYSAVNTSTRATILLPGTYTSSSSSFANSTLLSFGTTSTSSNSPGFQSSGALGSAFTVALQPGVTTYSGVLFEGTSLYAPISVAAATTTINASIGSLLLSSNVWAVVTLGGSSGNRVVVWDSIADVRNLAGGGSGVLVSSFQSSTCSTPCASGGVCLANSTCSCFPGFSGASCNACAAGFFGKACAPCPPGCASCDGGITGTGRCLTSSAPNVTASACNCLNGICASDSVGATCSCNAGWATAVNGTQCAACASGYYASSNGDCLACDPSCETCTGPTGTCLTCQGSLKALSTDATKCTTASEATANNTFVACSDGQYFDSTSLGCTACNAVCSTCYSGSADNCIECRAPSVVLNGQCVAFSSRTGVCDSTGVVSNGSAISANAGWVVDNSKHACDALPAKCTAGGIDNFSSASTRSQLTCSACLAGTYLSNGACIPACPTGTTASSDGKSCIPCDSSCSACSDSPTYCTTCADSSMVPLNGTCVASCPVGYFNPTDNAACLPCHPDCETCGPTFDTCLTCPSTRPVLSATATCLQTCSSNEYYDTAKGACVACSSVCETCSGAGSGACLSCSSTTMLEQGTCVSAGCTVVDGFGVCLSALVKVPVVPSSPTTAEVKALPWWTILLIIFCALVLLGLVAYFWRRREKKRRQKQTARFATDLGNKEVAMKLRSLSPNVTRPTVPVAADYWVDDEVPLTPRLVAHEHHPVVDEGSPSRWSASSYGSKASMPKKPTARLQRDDTGVSGYSGRSLMSTAGRAIPLGDRNPFRVS